MTIQEIKQKCIDSLNEEPKEPTELEKGYSIAMRHIIEVLSQLPQKEISDEEIEEMLFHHSNEYAYGFKDAIKWYREQLKQRQ